MSAKHTPGPWKWDGHYVTDETNTLISIDGIAQPHGCLPDDDVSRANACLIAAAPDMLEALKIYIACRDAGQSGAENDAIESAIDKAEGRA